MTASRPLATRFRRLLPLVVVVCAVLGSGCRVIDVRVSNPLPSVRRVAIAPFINLSVQPDLDLNAEELKSGTFSDRRFAQAYFAELQKTPGFEAIPVGVVEQAIIAGRLPMNGPDDYLAVCEAIGADAICIGAVTDFDPYHPRLGLQVNWYSIADVTPHVPMTPYERTEAMEQHLPPPKSRERTLWPPKRPSWLRLGGGHGDACQCPDCQPCIRSQSPTFDPLPQPSLREQPSLTQPSLLPQLTTPLSPHVVSSRVVQVEPLYSYTRYFDGRDAMFTARLRDYVELSGDLRSGGWESYLHRSDDFIRFCAHLMIEEMLLLHGGESGRSIIYKKRREK